MKATKFLPAVSGGRVVIMNKLLLLIVLCLAIPALAPAQNPLSPSYMPTIDTNAADYPSNIWVTDTMQKVQQQTGSPGSVHWGTFYGTQGEFVDFQVHIQAPSGGYSALSVSASNFVQSSPSSFTISASSKNVVVYREFYHDITKVTNTSPAYYNATGWYPDALIPAVDPYFNQTTNAFPVAVTANYNQSAWIDVFIPQNAPSGYYLGTITVSNSGTTLATLPIIIGVWQWPSAQGSHMPATSSLSTEFAFDWADFVDQFFGSYNNAGAMTGAGGNTNTGLDITNTYALTMFLDHRISVMDPVQNLNSTWENLFNGVGNSAYPPIIPGTAATGIKWYSAMDTRQQFSTLFQVTEAPAWPSMKPFDYVCDEPTSSGFSSCNSGAAADHALTPPLPVLIPTTLANATAGGGLNSIDYFVVEQATMYLNATNGGSGSQLANYQAWQATTNPDGIKRQLWVYESCSTGGTCGNGTVGPNDFNYPNDNIDGRPASNRAMEWMSFLNGQKGELSFAVTCAWPGSGCYFGSSSPVDPWVTVYTFGNNGDGTLVYPSNYTCGSGQTYPSTNCPYASKLWVTQPNGTQLTTPIPVPSMRLKLKRDGFQDYEYLKALTTAGQGSYVTSQINSWITNLDSYEYTGTGLQTARTNIGTALHQLSYPTTLLPPPSLTGSVQ
ncbi:MAG: hypothetical protein WAM58_16660 [Candidatus Acidiferrum sp.]